MTTTHRLSNPDSSALSVPASPTTRQSLDVFMALEMFPLMTGYWIASASSFDANAKNLASAYAKNLVGFTPREITAAIEELGREPDRCFAPTPAQLLQFLKSKRVPRVATIQAFGNVSYRMLELQAESRVFLGEITDEQVGEFISRKIAEIEAQGLRITRGIV